MGDGVMNSRTESQCKNILAYMEDHPEGITAVTAMQVFGVMRLAARISNLKDQGIEIDTTMEKGEGGVRYARYRLKEA